MPGRRGPRLSDLRLEVGSQQANRRIDRVAVRPLVMVRRLRPSDRHGSYLMKKLRDSHSLLRWRSAYCRSFAYVRGAAPKGLGGVVTEKQPLRFADAKHLMKKPEGPKVCVALWRGHFFAECPLSAFPTSRCPAEPSGFWGHQFDLNDSTSSRDSPVAWDICSDVKFRASIRRAVEAMPSTLPCALPLASLFLT